MLSLGDRLENRGSWKENGEISFVMTLLKCTATLRGNKYHKKNRLNAFFCSPCRPNINIFDDGYMVTGTIWEFFPLIQILNFEGIRKYKNLEHNKYLNNFNISM